MRVALVPGFTQTARSWDRVIDALPAGVEARALDVPTGLDFVATAQALGDTGGPTTYVGYSMGGRLCLQLALDRPAPVERLVLVSASPGIADPSQRSVRRQDDERLARDIERGGAADFLDRWLAQPLFATLPQEAAALDARIRDPARLVHQLRALGQGAMEPLADRLGELAMPVTLIVGALDEKYTAIATRMRGQIGGATLDIVEGAGHAVHLEQPDAVARIVGS